MFMTAEKDKTERDDCIRRLPVVVSDRNLLFIPNTLNFYRFFSVNGSLMEELFNTQ